LSLKFLKKAIELDDLWRKVAKTDLDFDNIRDSKKFRDLVGA
jgi:hypothetical protein